MDKKRGGQRKNKVKIKWSRNFAYAIGLLVSDGCLKNDRRHIDFTSKDLQLVQEFKKALSIKNKIWSKKATKKDKRIYYRVSFGDKTFYEFLEVVGLSQRKSKTLTVVKIPNKYFIDFFRGIFDGDGSVYVFWDKRWPNSFGYILTIASASNDFLKWLKKKMTKLYGVHGFICKGKGVYEIRYTKRDTQKIYNGMYHQNKPLFLKRKYTKLKGILAFDKKNKSCRGSSVARAEA